MAKTQLKKSQSLIQFQSGKKEEEKHSFHVCGHCFMLVSFLQVNSDVTLCVGVGDSGLVCRGRYGQLHCQKINVKQNVGVQPQPASFNMQLNMQQELTSLLKFVYIYEKLLFHLWYSQVIKSHIIVYS